MMRNDKSIELNRYDRRAQTLISKIEIEKFPVDGADAVSLTIRTPYSFYEEVLLSNISKDFSVLELGAGTGPFTGVLLRTGATICATDISEKSLEFLAVRHYGKGTLDTRVADMECLPFPDNYFDIVTCAGSLSYGDNLIVKNEIFRVLRPSGIFVCVDSLNNNPIYRFNRWIHYICGNRTKSTLLRMPTIRLIDQYRTLFGHVEVHFFGSVTWCIPFFVKLFGEVKASRFSDWFDRFIGARSSAFKFVMIAKKCVE